VAEELLNRGARSVYAAVSHGVLSQGSTEKLQDSPIERLFITDTVETQPTEFCEKIEVVSVAPLFAEAIKRIHSRESISVLFLDMNSMAAKTARAPRANARKARSR